MALQELGLEYENTEIKLFERQQQGPSFLKINPLGKVPVLEDGNMLLRESNAILAYLGKEYGGELWPSNPIFEASALEWLFFEATQMAACYGAVWFNDFVMPKLGLEPKSKSEIQGKIDRVEWTLDHLNNHLENNQFMMGDKFSLVDCSLGVVIAMLNENILVDSGEWKFVKAYLGRIVSRDSWKNARGSAIWKGETHL
jgi:glutathione S-transferase